MKRVWLAAALVAGLPAGQPGRRTDPPVVVIDTIVSDANGVPIHGLTEEAFGVTSELRVQPIVSVTADPQPLSVVFLLDVSESAVSLWRPSVTSVVTALAGTLRPGDRARLGSIAAHPALGPWTTTPAALTDAVPTVLTPNHDDAFGPSPIWDAVDATLDALATEPGRRTIVLLTDGYASGNVHGVDEVATRAATLGVSVNIIAGASGFNAGRMLAQLASTSGGLALYWNPAPSVTINHATSVAPAASAVSGATFAAQVSGRVLDDLRNCYRVSFVPDRSDDVVHSVTVSIKTAGLKTRARTLFVAKAAR